MTEAEQAAKDAEDKAAADAAAKAKAEGGDDDAPSLTQELVAGIVDTQKRIADSLENQPAPVAPVAGITPEQQYAKDREAYDARVVEADKKFETLAAEGKYAEGAKQLRETIAAIPRPPAQDPTQTPYYTSLAESALARAKDPDKVIEQWGDEVRSEIADLDPAERITDKGIQSAIDRVKASHINDILEASKEQIKADLLKNPSMMQNAPTGGGDETGVDAHGLDLDQQMFAQACGVSNEEYATMEKLPLNRDGTKQILPDLDSGAEIKPGAF